MRRRVAALGFLVLGAAPGLVLPFALPVVAGTEISDALLLALSIALIVSGIFAASVEAAFAAEIAVVRRDGAAPTMRSVAVTGLRSLRTSSWVAVIVYFALAAGYSLVDHDATVRIASTWPLALVPIIAIAAAPWSGFLVAFSRLNGLLFSTFFRTAPALLVLTLGAGLFSLSLALACGEAVRCGYLAWRVRVLVRTNRAATTTLAPVPSRQLWVQFSGQVVGQGAPALARVFLVAGPPGSVTSGELANRIYQAAYQVVNSVVVLPEIPNLPAVFGDPQGGTKARMASLRRVLLPATVIACAVAALALVLAWASLAYESSWSLGAMWAIILLVGLPFAAASTWAGRSLLVLKRANLLPAIATASLGAAALAGISLFPLLGAASAPVALAVGQIASGTLGVVTAFRVARRSAAG
ncbi:MAG: hypothetical protein ACTHMQ_14220 [Protaetiibacter sp.]